MFLNKRTQKRRPLYYYLPVINKETSALIGRIGDITSEGALLLSPGEIKNGEQLNLTISLPSEIHLGAKEITVKATVQWCSPDVNPDITLVGCKFHDVSAKEQRTIEMLVNAIGFHNENPLRGSHAP
jgi:hypothetical protein